MKLLKNLFKLEKKVEKEETSDISKIELIQMMLKNNYSDNNDNFKGQISTINEKNYQNIIKKIKIAKIADKEINSLIISKNTLLIYTNSKINNLNKINFLSSKKTFLNKSDSTEDGFIYIIYNHYIFISFFSNLFNEYLGIEENTALILIIFKNLKSLNKKFLFPIHKI